MQVTVFGAAGFVGLNVVKRLSGKSLRVRATDIRPMMTEVSPEVEFVSADILDEQHVDQLIAGTDIVIHHAVSNLRTSLRNPKRNVRINIEGTMNILEAARRHRVRKIIYSSASSVYGRPKYMPVDEDHPKAPTTIYGVAKYTGEHLIRVYHELHGMDYFVFRFTNVYGPYQHPDTGGVIPLTMSRILRGEEVVVYGDGSQTRDFVYVSDLADLICDVVVDETMRNMTVNAGSGVQTAIIDVVQGCGRALGRDPRVRFEPTEGGERRGFEADMARCQSVFGRLPGTSLEEGLGQTAAWLVQALGGG